MPYTNAAEAGETYADTMRRSMNRLTCDKMLHQRRLAVCHDTNRNVGQRFLIGQLNAVLTAEFQLLIGVITAVVT